MSLSEEKELKEMDLERVFKYWTNKISRAADVRKNPVRSPRSGDGDNMVSAGGASRRWNQQGDQFGCGNRRQSATSWDACDGTDGLLQVHVGRSRTTETTVDQHI